MTALRRGYGTMNRRTVDHGKMGPGSEPRQPVAPTSTASRKLCAENSATHPPDDRQVHTNYSRVLYDRTPFRAAAASAAWGWPSSDAMEPSPRPSASLFYT